MEGHKNGMTELLNAIGLSADKARVVAKLPAQKHYGVWHPERSWATTAPGSVMAFASKAVAEAQRDAFVFTLRGLTSIDSSLYEVRCIEEWADEQQNEAS